MDYRRQAYVDSHLESNLLLIAKFSAIKLRHPDKFIRWYGSSEGGLDVEVCEVEEETIKIPPHWRSRCSYTSNPNDFIF